MLRCGSFDEEALNDFIDDYRGPQGDKPEKFDLDQLQQGSELRRHPAARRGGGTVDAGGLKPSARKGV